mgnify:CR=1 FL=1
MSTGNVLSFPPQKKLQSEKNEKWYKDCIDAAERVATYSHNTGIRDTYYNKVINYNLANGIVDQKDIDRAINPFGLKGATFPGTFQNYPVSIPKINLLIGEEAKRPFEWRVIVTNEDAIAEKEEDKKEKLTKFIIDLSKQDLDKLQQEKEIQKFSRFLKYDMAEQREQLATHTLNYLWYEQKLPEKFNTGFYDALIAAEELYCCDIVGGDPILRKVNPLGLFTLRAGLSP